MGGGGEQSTEYTKVKGQKSWREAFFFTGQTHLPTLFETPPTHTHDVGAGQNRKAWEGPPSGRWGMVEPLFTDFHPAPKALGKICWGRKLVLPRAGWKKVPRAGIKWGEGGEEVVPDPPPWVKKNRCKAP